MKLISVYKFKNINNLYCDFKGNFFYDEKPIKKKWRIGQIYIDINKKRYGMNTLRKLTYKSTIINHELPF